MKTTIVNRIDKTILKFNPQSYIQDSPVKLLHKMRNIDHATTADIEICAMWTAMLSLGADKQTINVASDLMDLCEWQPATFVKGGDFYDIPDNKSLLKTINGKNFKAVNHILRQFYNKYPSVAAYIQSRHDFTLEDLLCELCDTFSPAKLGSPARNSCCKRVNTLLRWMVRDGSVDLGLWQTSHITPRNLYAIMSPLASKQAKQNGIISYSPNSWKAVIELTNFYRELDENDPLKYDLILSTQNLMQWKQ